MFLNALTVIGRYLVLTGFQLVIVALANLLEAISISVSLHKLE